MSAGRVMLLATCDTKGELVRYLTGRLRAAGVETEVVDIALNADRQLAGAAKLEAMRDTARRAVRQIEAGEIPAVLIGMGGGTGAQMVADVYRMLSPEIPKVLVTTLASDLRRCAAAGPLVAVYSQVDLVGLNPLLRRAMDDAAAAAAGLVAAGPVSESQEQPQLVALSALGITQAAVDTICAELERAGLGAAVFHASYHGGTALCGWLNSGRCAGIIDATVHDLTGLLLETGAPISDERFCAGSDLPRVVLPGAVNVRTCGPLASLDADLLAGPHYAHSPEFTHVALNGRQLADAGKLLGEELARTRGPLTVILPMGGFSSEDCPGGAVENSAGRRAFAETLCAALPKRAQVLMRDEHIGDPAVGVLAVERMQAYLTENS